LDHRAADAEFPENSEFNREFGEFSAVWRLFLTGDGVFATRHQGVTEDSLFGAGTGNFFELNKEFLSPNKSGPCKIACARPGLP
jgi:hypothetical protein